MEKNNIILIAIAILVIALIAVAAFIYMGENTQAEITETVNNTTTKTVIDSNGTDNTTVVGYKSNL